MRTANSVERIYDAMVGRVRRSQVIHADNTPVPVLDPTLGQLR